MITFDRAYYDKLIDGYGYAATHGPCPVDFGVGGLSLDDVSHRWVCHDGADRFFAGVRDGLRSIVTTGVGLGGVPHAGTVCQLLRAITLQQVGLTVQVVLGDLDSYNARNMSLEDVRRLAEQYHAFLVRLGFDTVRGIIRTQESALPVLRNAFMLGRLLDDSDFHAASEDLSDLYVQESVYGGLTFGIKLSTLLMLSDFISLLDEYDQVLVTLGVDEHKYVKLSRDLAHRAGHDPRRIAGIYTAMIPGLMGYPKMSKSIPASNINVLTEGDQIRERLVGSPVTDGPEHDAVFQIFNCIPEHLGAAAAEARLGYTQDRDEAGHFRLATADSFGSVCQAWPR